MTPQAVSWVLAIVALLSFGSVGSAHAEPPPQDPGIVEIPWNTEEDERSKGTPPPPGAPSAATGVRRFALVVGANDGGPERVRLQYATHDGNLVARVLRELGGVRAEDIVRLDDPEPHALAQAFAHLAERVAEADRELPTQFVFYYSGHSDDTGLLFGRDRLPYRELKAAVEGVPADVRIAILDSCASGAFTRLKGGTRQAPFLVASSSDVKGHAFLTSSSADEAAQESDRVGGSFFTHYLTTGLRGAADGNGDRIITLSEAYQFAFDETLARTESTRGGPQHAAYDIQLSGTGDLVMTDLRRTTGRLELAPSIGGRVSVRTDKGVLAAELYKLAGSDPVVLALEPGHYRVVVDDGARLLRADVIVGVEPAMLTPERLVPVPVETTVPRGDGAPPEDALVNVPFDIGLVPAISLGARRGPRIRNAVNLSALFGRSEEVDGIAIALGISIVTKHLRGLQWASAAAIAHEHASGLQFAWGWNAARTLRGVQAGFANRGHEIRGAQLGILNMSALGRGIQAGLFNVARSHGGSQWGAVNAAGRVEGIQVGLVNVAEDAEAQLGLFSYSKQGGVHPELWTSDVGAVHVGLRLPARRTYSLVTAGVAPFVSGHQAWTLGVGFGGHVPLPNRMFVDIDVVSSAVLRFRAHVRGDALAPMLTVRVLAGWAPFARLAVFAGPTLNVMVDRFAGNDVPQPGYGWTHYQRTWKDEDEDPAVNESERLRIWIGFAAGFRF